MSRVRRVSFVVRVVQDREGHVNGVIERVATGAKEAFDGMEVIGEVILRMLMREARFPGGCGAGTPGSEPRAGDPPQGGSTR
jgi:hypothetical protein